MAELAYALSEAPRFDAAFRAAFAELLAWRRDVRHFRSGEAPDERVLAELFDLASLAPSVGNCQPTRFVRVDDEARRAAIRANFERANAAALAAQEGPDSQHYARLKLAGLDEAPVQVGVFADRGTNQGRGLGRRTMPETIEYSAVMAIHTLWLAARAEGIGLGWVSILETDEIPGLLEIPAQWSFIGYLCLGYPEAADDTPALEREGWERRRDWQRFVVRR
jgi:5,6-dimethylbenzimidazole synthase